VEKNIVASLSDGKKKMKRNNFRYSALFHFNRSRNKTNFARSEKIHFDAKQWTDPNFRINKIGFSIHHSGKRAFRSRASVCSRSKCIRNSEVTQLRRRPSASCSIKASKKEKKKTDERRICGSEESKRRQAWWGYSRPLL